MIGIMVCNLAKANCSRGGRVYRNRVGRSGKEQGDGERKL